MTILHETIHHEPTNGPDGYSLPEVLAQLERDQPKTAFEEALDTLTHALMRACLVKAHATPELALTAPPAVEANFRRASAMALVLADAGLVHVAQSNALQDVLDEFDLEVGSGDITLCRAAIRAFLLHLAAKGGAR